jgi:hypothetical protein
MVALAEYERAVPREVVRFAGRFVDLFPVGKDAVGVKRTGSARAAPVAGNGSWLPQGRFVGAAGGQQTSQQQAVQANSHGRSANTGMENGTLIGYDDYDWD